MQQLTNFNAEQSAIQTYTPQFDGLVSFRTNYDPQCWRSSVQLMYVLGEALFIAQNFSLHKDGQGNYDHILLPIDRNIPYGYALRRITDAALGEEIIFLGGVSKATAKEDEHKFTEDPDSFFQEAKEEHFKAIRVGYQKVWRLQREFRGWSCPNPREDAHLFMSDFNSGVQLKHPAEIAMELVSGSSVKVYGNFAGKGYTHPQVHLIKSYRKAAWKAYYPDQAYPQAKGEQPEDEPQS